MAVYRQQKDERMIESCSPLSSVSHVSMTAPGTGCPPVVSTRPSTYMYSPFPSDAIDSPNGTVDATKKEKHERRRRWELDRIESDRLVRPP